MIKPGMNTDLSRRLSLVIFFLGVIIGFVMAVITIWSRLEAINYYFTGAKYETFNGLRCPAMITPVEKGMVTAVFNNPTNKEDNFFYRAEISGEPSTRQIEGQIEVSPHHSESIQVTVDANDTDLGFFIFVKMNILPTARHRSREAVCGILVTNIVGLTGTQLSTTAIALSFVGIAVGLGIWQRSSNEADQNIQRAIQVLVLMVLLTLLAAAMGWWLAGMGLSGITMLLIVISLRFILS
jgi:hypothetical protein